LDVIAPLYVVYEQPYKLVIMDLSFYSEERCNTLFHAQPAFSIWYHLLRGSFFGFFFIPLSFDCEVG